MLYAALKRRSSTGAAMLLRRAYSAHLLIQDQAL
jgi:hypothetical protein